MAADGDHVVVRRLSPPDTLGGGTVLDAGAASHGRRADVLARLAARRDGRPEPPPPSRRRRAAAPRRAPPPRATPPPALRAAADALAAELAPRRCSSHEAQVDARRRWRCCAKRGARCGSVAPCTPMPTSPTTSEQDHAPDRAARLGVARPRCATRSPLAQARAGVPRAPRRPARHAPPARRPRGCSR